MLSIFEILFPVFALIFSGFACRRRALLGPAAASEINAFVVWLALPALLFESMAHTSWRQLYQPGFTAAFALACGAVFLVTLVARLRGGRHLADASIDAIGASYPNVGYVGFPLCLIVFGKDSLVPTTIATFIVVCVLFATAIMVIEASLQGEKSLGRLAGKVGLSLLRNPLILAPVAGMVVAAAHITLPGFLETFIKLLGEAASPCALVSLGLFLAEKRPAGDTSRDSLLLSAGKLVLQPALTWWLAAQVFALPSALVEIAVLLAALPTGTGPYMLAEFYRREARITSQTILLSTVGSVVTLSLILLYIGRGG